MNFRSDLCDAVLEGRKTVTRRLASDNERSPWALAGCGYTAGRRYAICPGRGEHRDGTARVESVTLEPLGALLDLTGAEREAEARREGFESFEAFWHTWQALNAARKGRASDGRVVPGTDPAVLVWRVELRDPERTQPRRWRP